MDISPSKEEEISACEKLRDTATVASQSFTKPFKSMQDSIVLALGTVYGSISVEHRSLDEKKRKTWVPSYSNHDALAIVGHVTRDIELKDIKC
ncbi:hypothetical protein TNIN_157911 [Trichonephila inaurata madagascariensis]|uniref:Uncharacterized protein n=1 Tax=Trichonephila inaurata madagascariensis TaxID=2747483 RepID=A0A8X6XBL6_9ARAC|nr:hypothetical protein TNIN_157911 [Trichonephila inaurata madagascariensis]